MLASIRECRIYSLFGTTRCLGSGLTYLQTFFSLMLPALSQRGWRRRRPVTSIWLSAARNHSPVRPGLPTISTFFPSASNLAFFSSVLLHLLQLSLSCTELRISDRCKTCSICSFRVGEVAKQNRYFLKPAFGHSVASIALQLADAKTLFSSVPSAVLWRGWRRSIVIFACFAMVMLTLSWPIVLGHKLYSSCC
jgi:hypothetical protein